MIIYNRNGVLHKIDLSGWLKDTVFAYLNRELHQIIQQILFYILHTQVWNDPVTDLQVHDLNLRAFGVFEMKVLLE